MFNKKNLPYYISLALVLTLSLLFWRLPYLGAYDGFEIMSLWNAGTWGVFVSLFQTLAFVALVGLIAVPMLGILSQRGIVKIKATEDTMLLINFINICVLDGVSFFNFIWNIVLASTAGAAFGVGSLFTAILVVGAMVLLILMQYSNKSGAKSTKTKKTKKNNDEIVVEVSDTETK